MEYPSIRVQCGPNNYYNHVNSIKNLSNFFSKEDLSSSTWIFGEKSGKAASAFLPVDIYSSLIKSFCIKDHCTHETVNYLCEKSVDSPAIIGIGGGTIMDIAKAVAAKLKKPFIAIPTIAATCAAWTPLSVWYSKEGKALGYEIFNQSTFLVLIEPTIIANAPVKYLKAGIADTLAKQYESEILVKGLNNIPYTAYLGLKIAQDINEKLVEQGPSAISCIDEKTVKDSLINVIDAVIAGGGLVGGLGERFTRVAAAHALHNGISSIEKSKEFLHGTKVAYGILVQSALLDDQELLGRQIKEFYNLGLPIKLSDINIDYSNKKEIDKIIETTLRPTESIHLLPFEINESILREAISKVENYNL